MMTTGITITLTTMRGEKKSIMHHTCLLRKNLEHKDIKIETLTAPPFATVCVYMDHTENKKIISETNANTVVPSTPTVNGASVNVTQDM